VKIRCVGEVFTFLKNRGFDIDTVRRLFYSRGQVVLGEFARKDNMCVEVEKYFGSFKKGGEKYDDYIKTAEKTKEDNLEKLKQLGII
jgi:hypothetical protein